MNLDAIPKFDPLLFTKKVLDGLQELADECEAATEGEAVEYAGARLDTRRAEHRVQTRHAAAVSRSMNAYFKVLIREVPRRADHNDPDGAPKAVIG